MCMPSSQKKKTMTLRRHKTSPSSAGRSVIAPVSVGRSITRQPPLKNYNRATMMKSNPYVGFIRHSPPTMSSRLPTATNAWPTNKTTMPWSSIPLSLADCKNSPHIGWFRHAPPSRFMEESSCNVQDHHESTLLLELLSASEKKMLGQLLQELDPSLKNVQELSSLEILNLSRKHLSVYGSLPGGGTTRSSHCQKQKRGRTSTSNKNQHHHQLVKDLTQSSAEGTLSTVHALSRLASWFLFPVAHDAESCGYNNHFHHPTKKTTKKSKDNGSSSSVNLLNLLVAPYLPTFLEEPMHAVPSQEEGQEYGCRQRLDSGSSEDDDDLSLDASSSVCDSEAPFPSLPSGLCADTNANNDELDKSRNRDLTLSVSSLAEAYYAHQTTKDIMMESSSSPTAAASHQQHHQHQSPDTVSPHRLDYVITQMDIARMTRNASRHLDVQSILSLPVITYKKGLRMTNQGWSWTIVEEAEGHSQEDSSTTSSGGVTQQQQPRQQQQQPPKGSETEFCVICLEHFEDGDRLRVLPCDHSFHVGCIDRWLSGSQSFDDCYTSGCPTCKKQPIKLRSQSFCEPTSSSSYNNDSNVRSEKHRSGSLDGSVPSWAFAQIGSALVAQQEQEQEEQGASICSGASSSSS